MIQMYGMSDVIGQLAFPKDQNAMVPDRMYSETTAQKIDEEAKLMIDNMYARTTTLLQERSKEVAELAEELLEKETVNHDDLVRILGARPFVASDAYEQYVNMTQAQASEAPADVADETAASDDGDDDATAGDVKPAFAATATVAPSSRTE
jgi:AFG3 family protein